MAVYKVPQDVEAEDKLIGPLSFRQFIYLMVAGVAAFIGFLLFQLSPFLVIIPMPIVFVFGGLALPLRKDQPMEVYLLAVGRFWLKPRRRVWNPDGTITYVEITAPRTDLQPLRSSLTPESTEERLDYLARIMDSRGWSMKRIDAAEASVAPGVADEAANATDIMDDHADLAKSFDDLLAKKNQQQREAALETMQQAKQRPQPTRQIRPSRPTESTLTQQFTPRPAPSDDSGIVAPHFNPYPTIHQKVINPYDEAPAPAPRIPQPSAVAQKTPTAMTAPVSPAIMRLASNNDLSISAIAREAHRLQEGDEGEVVITLSH